MLHDLKHIFQKMERYILVRSKYFSHRFATIGQQLFNSYEIWQIEGDCYGK